MKSIYNMMLSQTTRVGGEQMYVSFLNNPDNIHIYLRTNLSTVVQIL